MPTLHWIGKEKVVKHHHEVPFKILQQEYIHTAPEGTPANSTGNRIIHGDNLEALKALLPEFEGRVKCIYIDPPYNTGNEGWVYNDNVNEPRIQKWLQQVVGKEGEDLTRHDKWLCMMYPRLKLLHKLLAADGSIWVSIDDIEVANLRLVLDEIFGSSNFVANVLWQKRTSPDARIQLGPAHDHILVYQKSSNPNFNKLQLSEEQTKNFKNPDNDPRGPWASTDFTAQGWRPNQMYPLTTRAGIEYTPPDGRCWSNIEPEFHRLVADDRMWFGKDGKSRPRVKNFLSEVDGISSWTWWTNTDAGHNQEAKKEINSIIGGGNSFDTPKPARLIQRILQIATDNDSIILDSFAGSGTTAHAVLKLNAQDGGNRRFILTEMMEYAETITAERVRRVMGGYGSPSPQPSPPGRGSSFVAGLGGGFEYYTIGEALFDEDGNLNEAVPVDEIRRYVAYSEGIDFVGANGVRPEYGVRPPVIRHTDDGDDADMGACHAPLQIPHHTSYLGASADAAYFFHYEPGHATTLDYEFLSTLTFPDNRKPTTSVIYADNCLLSQEQLRKHGIIFKKIPRDITRF